MRIYATKGLALCHLGYRKIWRSLKKKTFCCTVTGSTGESKEKTKEDSDGDDEQSRTNEADDNEEGNLEDEQEDNGDGTGKQEQGTQEMEEASNLDLPDDLQLDEGENEGRDGELSYFPLPIF